MASSWGEQLRITLFGESHGKAIGVVLDHLPPGESVDLAKMQAFLDRRAPGRSPWSSQRREGDTFSILSGMYQGRTTGTPLCIVMENRDARSSDYEPEVTVPRPSHADFTGQVRYRGAADPRGGGHFSGRLTAPLAAAGAICLQILGRKGIEIFTRIEELGGISDQELDTANLDLEALRALAGKELPVLADDRRQEMIQAVKEAKSQGDSLGGVAQCVVVGLPPGLGDPIFGGVESRLASLLYGIPAVKGVSFGAGFAVSRHLGSQNNDSFYIDAQNRVRTRTNHDGGINGGITNGMPLVFQVAIKPTPSIALPQASVNLKTRLDEELVIKGRHDPAILPRAVVAIEAAAAIAITDLFLVAFGLQGWGGGEYDGA